METLFRLYTSIESKVRNYQDMIEVTKSLPYYDVFNLDQEKVDDLQLLHSGLKEVLSDKFLVLEKIKRQVELEMRTVSQQEREVTIFKNAAA